MSKQANKTVIGIFVVGAIALAIAAVLILGSGKVFRQTFRAVCYFDGSVGGLNVGAPVVFRGVKVGSVVDISLQFDRKELIFIIPVYIEIDPSKMVATGPGPKTPGENLKLLIDKGLRAQLEMQSFVTGQMQVGLDFHPNKPANFAKSKSDTTTPEIPTIPTPFQALLEKVEQVPIDQIIKDFQSTLKGIEKVVNSPEIGKTLTGLAQASEDVRVLMKNLNGQVSPLASRANETVGDIQKLVRDIDHQVTTLAGSVEDTVKDTRKQVNTLGSSVGDAVKDVQKQVNTLAASAEATVKDAQKLVQNIDGEVKPLSSNVQGVLADAQTMIKNVDGKIEQTVASVEATLKEVRKLVGDVDSEIKPLSASLEDKLKDVQKLVRNADGRVDQLGLALGKTLEAAGATLQEAQGTLRSIGGSTGENSPLIYELTQTLKELSTAARSLRALADYLDRYPEALIRGKK